MKLRKYSVTVAVLCLLAGCAVADADDIKCAELPESKIIRCEFECEDGPHELLDAGPVTAEWEDRIHRRAADVCHSRATLRFGDAEEPELVIDAKDPHYDLVRSSIYARAGFNTEKDCRESVIDWEAVQRDLDPHREASTVQMVLDWIEGGPERVLIECCYNPDAREWCYVAIPFSCQTCDEWCYDPIQWIFPNPTH